MTKPTEMERKKDNLIAVGPRTSGYPKEFPETLMRAITDIILQIFMNYRMIPL